MPEAAIFILGLIFGSLANVIIFRFHTSESIVSGSSKCLSCKKKLNWYELMPVISFVIQKGRCRACQTKLSWQYPLVEAASGMLFLLVWLKSGQSALSDLSVLSVLSILSVLSVWYLLFLASIYDLRHKILPDEFVYSAGVIALFVLFFNYGITISAVKEFLMPAFFTFLFFAGLWFFSKGKAMGFGDAKMAGVLGLFMGYPKIIFGLILSFWLGAVFGLGLIAVKKANFKTAVPFGPFIFAGCFFAWFSNINFIGNVLLLW